MILIIGDMSYCTMDNGNCKVRSATRGRKGWRSFFENWEKLP